MLSALAILSCRTSDMLGYMAKEMKDADSIKFANQLTLRCDYPGFSWWAQSKLDKQMKAKKWILS